MGTSNLNHAVIRDSMQVNDPGQLDVFSVSKQAIFKRRTSLREIMHDLHFLEPIANHLNYLQIGFVGIIEPRSIYEDDHGLDDLRI